MDKASRKGMLAGFIAFGLATTSYIASAEAITISYDVTSKSAGQIDLNLNIENISTQTLYNVSLSAEQAQALNYGDLAAGAQASQPVVITWDPNNEPPSLSWTISYTDAQGQTHTETQ